MPKSPKAKGKHGKKRQKGRKPLHKLVKPFNIASLVVRVIQAFGDKVHPAIAASLPGILRARDLAQLKAFISKYGSPQLYSDPDHYLVNAQILGLVKKYPFPGFEDQRRLAAMEKFHDGEALCAKTNARFRAKAFPYWVYNYLNRASLVIDKILGDFDRQYQTILRLAKHGPGSSICLGGDTTSEFYKYLDPHWSAKGATIQYLEDILADDHYLAAMLDDGKVLNECRHNFLTLVPKDAWTYRTIAIEPRLNLYLQLGAGQVIARNLMKFGINIRDQSRNQEGAFWASLGSGHATVDLTNASGSIASLLVKYMLRGSVAWYDFLYDTRSPNYSLTKEGDELHPYEGWSSMGNGYTFPLETAIFYSLARAVVDDISPGGDVLVYGDDIIIPSECYAIFSELLSEIGFVPNETKTFTQGPFRESCGKDFWYGIDVRPFYIREVPTVTRDINHIVNSLTSISGLPDLDGVVTWLLTHVNPRTLFFGPITGDTRGHIWAPEFWLRQTGKLRWVKRHQAFRYKTLKERPRSFRRVELQTDEAQFVSIYLSLKRDFERPLVHPYIKALAGTPTLGPRFLLEEAPTRFDVHRRARTSVSVKLTGEGLYSPHPSHQFHSMFYESS